MEVSKNGLVLDPETIKYLAKITYYALYLASTLKGMEAKQ